MKKEDHLKIEKVNLGPNKFFDFLNALPFSPKGFFTFLVVLAHGAAARRGVFTEFMISLVCNL